MQDWDRNKARQTYNIEYWGGGYFDVNEQGHVVACPDPEVPWSQVNLYELSREISEAGLSLPVLVRFSDILHHRVNSLCAAFETAMQANDYQGQYTAVYPIKVNQQKSVVDEILSQGAQQVGLEAGSKPELMAVLAQAHEASVIICNGYKDREYIRLALIGQALGLRVFIVVEKLSELEHIIRESGDLGIRPCLGVRVRLSSLGSGKWQNTGGDKSKFGLLTSQLLDMVKQLHEHDMSDCLQLLHFHMGSQISNIQDIHRGMREACRYYAELYEMGVSIRCLDVGGGLGVDYEGTRSRSFCSMNYSVQEYANNIVHTISDICVQENLPQPDIISESGRALTAHHAVLITNVIDTEVLHEGRLQAEKDDNESSILLDLYSGLQNLEQYSVLESYHNAFHSLQEAQQKYIHGMLSIQQRARAEQLYYATCRQVRDLLQPAVRAHRELLDELNEKLADKYFCNFSLFQSMPDVWAIQQIFPVMPLHRLDERPQRRALIQDLTCDSDGRIDLYVDSEGIEGSLPLHSLNADEEYILGFFMLGAYQEILGDMHNLFGDTDSVNVSMNDDGSYELVRDEQGDTVEEMLRYVHFDADELLDSYQQKIDQAGLADNIRNIFMAELEAGLRGYTYLED
jgi:arginine decarboxylase